MASRSITAQQALDIGLVHEVYEDAVFAQRVQEFACGLTQLSGEALGLAKLAIDAAASADRTTARDVDRIANTLLLLSDKNRGVVKAYSNRTKKGDAPDHDP
jgi:enoyl-CoA hydratase/carnithine racemase